MKEDAESSSSKTHPQNSKCFRHFFLFWCDTRKAGLSGLGRGTQQQASLTLITSDKQEVAPGMIPLKSWRQEFGLPSARQLWWKDENWTRFLSRLKAIANFFNLNHYIYLICVIFPSVWVNSRTKCKAAYRVFSLTSHFCQSPRCTAMLAILRCKQYKRHVKCTFLVECV